jgi:hypothetical protein
MPTNIATDTKGSKATLIKTRGHEKLIESKCNTSSSGSQETTNTICYSRGGEKNNNLVKQKLPTGMIFKCKSKGR